ncbi:MAG: hypothetical protein PHS54_01465 [Clostridia bacterium]|nr:hypothetical protein [Clostridia bacterium]
MEKTKDANAIYLKNSHMIILSKLLNVKLKGSISRKRNRFINELSPRLREIEKERISILEKHSVQDDKGKAIIENGNYKIDVNKVNEINKELNDFYNEEFIIDVFPSNKENIMAIKDIILDTEIEFDTNEGQQYEEICQEFENTTIK